MAKIPFINPTFPPPSQVAKALKQIYRRNYYTNNGPVYYQFRSALEKYIGNDLQVCVTANATSALILAAKALMRTGKSEVLVPAFTFAAGPQAIRWAGFEPLLIDIDSDSLQPSLEQADQYLESNSSKVAGILLCNSFGIGNPQIKQWEKLAKQHHQPLVIDSAAGFGSKYPDGELLGARGDCEIFSFHATKTFSIGEGGAISSHDSRLIDRLERNKNFGFDKSNEALEAGLNAKITELDCAIGLEQLRLLDDEIGIQQSNLGKYITQLRSFGLEFAPAAEISTVQFVTTILPRHWDRNKLLKRFQAADIEVKHYYSPPIHQQAAFRKAPKLDLTNTDDIARRVLSLPMSTKLTDREIERVVDVFREYSATI